MRCGGAYARPKSNNSLNQKYASAKASVNYATFRKKRIAVPAIADAIASTPEGEPPGRTESSKNAPSGHRSASYACPSQLQGSEQIGACGGRIVGSRLGHAGRRFGLVTRTRVASAVAREPAALRLPHLRIFTIDCVRSGVLFSPLSRQWLSAVVVAHAASCGTQRASHLSTPTCTCQSDNTCRLPISRVQVSISPLTSPAKNHGLLAGD